MNLARRMCCAVVAVCSMTVFAEDTEVIFTGMAGLDVGQIVKGEMAGDKDAYLNPVEVTKGWQQRFLFQFGSNYLYKERLRLVINIEGRIDFAYPQSNIVTEFWPSVAPQYNFTPIQAEGSFTLGDLERPWLQVGMGYFPFKFNPDAKNLGEFHFRTGTYPVYLISNFNHCWGNLLGLRLTNLSFDNLRQDLLLTSETLMFPTQDYSLSYFLRYSLQNAVSAGAGISLAHVFKTGKYSQASFSGVQPVVTYIKKNGDTAFIDVPAVKPSVTASVDPKSIFGAGTESGIFGKEDLKIYGEACVTAWADIINYDKSSSAKHYFENRSDRMMYMFGINIPAFRTLDVLSLEFEHFPNKYPNSYYNLMVNTNTEPLTYTNVPFSISPWKFTVYAKKIFLDRYSITGQIARDHYRPYNIFGRLLETEEVLKAKGDWWWALNLSISM